MNTTLTVMMTEREAEGLVDDFDITESSSRKELVDQVAEMLGLGAGAGGWQTKVTAPRAGGIKIVGTFVPAGSITTS